MILMHIHMKARHHCVLSALLPEVIILDMLGFCVGAAVFDSAYVNVS